MKKIALSLVIIAVVAFANTNTKLQQDIADTEAQIKKLNDSLAALKAQLIVVKKPNDFLKEDDKFVAHLSAGYIQTSGNTKTQTYNLDAKVKKGWQRHIFTLSFDGQFASENTNETKNKFFTELEYDYEFSKIFSFSYLVGYKQDKFSGYKYQAYTGPGAKYKLIDTDKHQLGMEGNVLYAVDEIEEVALVNAYTDSYLSLRAKAVYSWQMLENLKFDQELTYRSQADELSNYFVYSKTGFSSKISDVFSAGLSYKLDYFNEPADGKTSTDKTVTLNLMADY